MKRNVVECRWFSVLGRKIDLLKVVRYFRWGGGSGSKGVPEE